MAALCGSCGKRIAAGGKSILAIVVIAGSVLAAGACSRKITESRKDNGIAASAPQSAASGWHRRSHDSDQAALLTKEEVGDIIGRPVTEIAMSGQSNATYKTATAGFEAAIEVEHKDDGDDATQTFEAARTVTKRMAGGTGASIAGIGDDALYGAFNVLYVRRNDVVLTITPPNLQQAAQSEQMNNVLSQPLGSDAQRQALEKLSASMKGDPIAASLAKPDAVSGAVDLIHHSASERGDEYETKARQMARQMAEKVLSKIGT